MIVQLWPLSLLSCNFDDHVELKFSQVCYYMQMLRYTKWEHWSLAITNSVHSVLEERGICINKKTRESKNYLGALMVQPQVNLDWKSGDTLHSGELVNLDWKSGDTLHSGELKGTLLLCFANNKVMQSTMEYIN